MNDSWNEQEMNDSVSEQEWMISGMNDSLNEQEWINHWMYMNELCIEWTGIKDLMNEQE